MSTLHSPDAVSAINKQESDAHNDTCKKKNPGKQSHGNVVERKMASKYITIARNSSSSIVKDYKRAH